MRVHIHLRNSILPALLGFFALPIPAGNALAQGQQVSGHIYWQDENGDPHPAYRALVEVWQVFSDGTPTNFLEETYSQEDGFYHIVTPGIQWTGGEADLRLVVRTTNAWVLCRSDEGDAYPFLGDPTTVPEDGPRIIDFTIGNTANQRAMSVHQAATWGAHLLYYRRGAVHPPQVAVTWPDTADYFAPSVGGRIGVTEFDAFQWDLIQHLYGHFALGVLGLPSGFHELPHNPGVCLSDELGKPIGTATAWREGWSMFYACLAQAEAELDTLDIPRVGDAIYSDWSNGEINVDLDAQTPEARGEDNDVAIARFLWDLYDDDAAPEGRDDHGIAVGTLWNRIVGDWPARLDDAWPGLMSASPGDRRFVGNVGADHGIGPEILGPANGAMLDSLPTLSWTRAVGCSPDFRGTHFAIEFYDKNSSGTILSMAVGPMTTWQMTDAVVQQLRGLTAFKEVQWAVLARQSLDEPETGLYRGETRFLSINRAPDADINGPAEIACQGTGGTPGHYSGSGSTDPDGDDLTYSWYGNGVQIEFPEASGIVGVFPPGQTWLYLTVSDGVLENTDSLLVTILDDEAPTIETVASRSLIWPPNNKMSPIEVMVDLEDNCDPAPDFVLSEIVVLENGVPISENQARHDYDGADFGTDDAVFELRAERSGGTERKYLVIFTAFDSSGNSTRDTVCVRVPSSQVGQAMASSGFAPDGSSLGTTETFSLIIPSGSGLNAATVDKEKTYVGNHLGAVQATRARMFVREGEEIGELEVAFPTAPARALIAASGPNVDVSLHFTTTDGTDYLVLDILDLGTPVRTGREETGDDLPPVADGTAEPSGAESAATPELPLGLYATRLERAGAVTVEVFTVTGRRVRTVFRDELGPGTYNLPWDGKSDSGHTVPSGIYFYRITQPAGQVVRKVMVVR